jgi:hypothetical protein
MNDGLDRRSLLKGLLAVPFVSAVDLLNTTPAVAQSPATPIRLNLVMHGSFVYEFDKPNGQLTVLAPTVKDEKGKLAHCYKSGLWRAEQPMQPNIQYPLKGLSGAPAGALPPEIATNTGHYAIIRRKLTPTGTSPYCSLSLPMPKSVTSAYAWQMNGSRKFFEAAGLPLESQPTQLPMTVVLEYALDLGYKWTDCINIHVFADAPTEPADAHANDAFMALKSLYKGLDDFKITSDASTGANYSSVILTRPPCITEDEAQSLAGRVGGGVHHGGARVGGCLQLMTTF